jgi:hypothetical protein
MRMERNLNELNSKMLQALQKRRDLWLLHPTEQQVKVISMTGRNKLAL